MPLVALDTRIARLRERLADGDPDMEPDETQVAIDRAEAKRRELETTLQSAAKLSAKIVSALPKAADLYRRKIASGIDNDPTAAMEARLLRTDPDGGLYADYWIRPGALLQGVGTDGSGGPLWQLFAKAATAPVTRRCRFFRRDAF